MHAKLYAAVGTRIVAKKTRVLRFVIRRSKTITEDLVAKIFIATLRKGKWTRNCDFFPSSVPSCARENERDSRWNCANTIKNCTRKLPSNGFRRTQSAGRIIDQYGAQIEEAKKFAVKVKLWPEHVRSSKRANRESRFSLNYSSLLCLRTTSDELGEENLNN